MVITKEDEERFWGNVDRTTTPEGCWLWSAGRDKGGYGQIRVNGRAHYTHRIAWILIHGPIPVSFLVVMHTCDNRPCCNPAHLELKTGRRITKIGIRRVARPTGNVMAARC